MKKWLTAGGIVLLILCGLCVGHVWSNREKPVSQAETRVAETVSAAYESASAEEEPEAEAEAVEEAVPYESPVDFTTLQSANEDIYAWLYIPGTEINYPLLQRSDAADDDFYLTHNSDGDTDSKGALFTQAAYNQKDFSDRVTVIYGHHMRSGVMFGHLQELYSGEDGLEKYREIIVYLPDRELHYSAFAGVPHDNSHLLYNHDFTNTEEYRMFLAELLSVRTVDASRNESIELTTKDDVLILSTCLSGNNKKRYLVLARRDD